MTRTATGDDAAKYPGRLGVDPGLPLKTALRAITLNAAYSLHQETTTGSIEVGKWADLIVLDRNLFEIDPQAIGDTKVLMTMVGGKVVYEPKREDGGFGVLLILGPVAVIVLLSVLVAGHIWRNKYGKVAKPASLPVACRLCPPCMADAVVATALIFRR